MRLIQIYSANLERLNRPCNETVFERGINMATPRGTDSAQVISVIETKALRGAGTDTDPCRYVTQYWDFNGKLLAENDEWQKEKE